MKSFMMSLVAVVLVGSMATSASALPTTVFDDDFSTATEGNNLTGHNASGTGQTWAAFDLFGFYGSFAFDDQYSPFGNGSGNQAPGSTNSTDFGNSVPLGTTLTSNVVTYDLDLTHSLSGASGFTIAWLSDSVNGSSIAVTRNNTGNGVNVLAIGGPGFAETAFSTGVFNGGGYSTLHLQIEVDLGNLANTKVHYYDFNDPGDLTTSGTIAAPMSGTYQPDRLHIWGRAATSDRY